MNNAEIVQTLIVTMGTPIAVDGVIGPQTLFAIKGLFPYKQRVVMGFAEKLDVPVSLSDVIPIKEINKLVKKVSKTKKVSQRYLSMTLELENWKTKTKDAYFNIRDGKYIGLGQFHDSAWAESSNTPYPQGALEPEEAISAIAQYYLNNKKRFLTRYPGQVFSDQIGYVYHNQGPSGAERVIEDGYVDKRQSKDAQLVMAYAHQQATNWENFSVIQAAGRVRRETKVS
jgi:hypothetical protein